ncbi:MAG: HypC/HybG/HupF family hydrogenase formation chaperone [Verrucomicrobia bacterium]|nr:HypC/HybG/HupF family hydrogenase formation chaperone [Verrucomicrobiota bacterium]MBU4246988.1 HypC/HybG/HupF family hydrogenase formation chaperone [Verrucomicrobiota bacterium]MBU4291763.1 HypC/HybG/HupF family hydrogenase formation chaperone [Verrucomicrobiota bacterium]MBU4498284.1 HypC/HybG/HupF family hydrogenase formation chaperone [Verrucomicrobiota bacterium]MCG2681591.1 HypC/HybG/HupF family hydrogenase formation chaperone [Kiritimatiellia bacterium]
MCLAIPAKIVELDGENAVVDIQGVRRTAIVTFIANPQIGDYVLLHAGFAIRKWSEDDVREFYEIVNGTAPE